MNNKKKCFVVMPFSKTQSCTEQKWTEIFEYIIKPAVEESGLGYECKRSIAERQNIIKGILEALNKANVVIADLTDNNQNVFYELGVRHTLANRTILIAQGEEHIPFDLRPYPVAFYSEPPAKIAEFKKDIKRKLEDIETNPERSDNPVADFLEHKNIDLLFTQKSENSKKLTALVSELSENLDYAKLILEEAANNQKIRKEKRKEEIIISTVRFDTTCLDLLISTHYVTLSEKLLQSALETRKYLKLSNAKLDNWHEDRFAESIEEQFVDFFPTLKERITTLIKEISTIRVDYINDNYKEPSLPPPILSRPEHREYVKST